MKLKRTTLTATAASIGMLLLILDSKTALKGAAEGIDLCIRTVIPSLFPLFMLSSMLTVSLSGGTIAILRPIGIACGIPKGAESLLLIGLLGGYPVGAQNIYHAYRDGFLDDQQARRMLGFCNNAGPAFIFGIAGGLFHSQLCTWVLWGIHIFSAILVGMILPRRTGSTVSPRVTAPIALTQSVTRSVRVMGEVCGWIILFRVVLTILQRWLLWLIPDIYTSLLYGSLELVNGCHFLHSIPTEGTRFILCAVFLAFGGACVGMQTMTVTRELGGGWYFPGKILQSLISILLAFPLQYVLFDAGQRARDFSPLAIAAASLIIMAVPFGAKLKKTVAFQRELVYNR